MEFDCESCGRPAAVDHWGEDGLHRYCEACDPARALPPDTEPLWRSGAIITSLLRVNDPAERARQAASAMDIVVSSLASVRADAVAELHEAGMSWAKIGRAIGVSPARAHNIAYPVPGPRRREQRRRGKQPATSRRT